MYDYYNSHEQWTLGKKLIQKPSICLSIRYLAIHWQNILLFSMQNAIYHLLPPQSRSNKSQIREFFIRCLIKTILHPLVCRDSNPLLVDDLGLLFLPTTSQPWVPSTVDIHSWKIFNFLELNQFEKFFCEWGQGWGGGLLVGDHVRSRPNHLPRIISLSLTRSLLPKQTLSLSLSHWRAM